MASVGAPACSEPGNSYSESTKVSRKLTEDENGRFAGAALDPHAHIFAREGSGFVVLDANWGAEMGRRGLAPATREA
jgi:hypothetical protein